MTSARSGNSGRVIGCAGSYLGSCFSTRHISRVSNQRAGGPPVPQPRLQAGIVETAVGAEVGAAPGDLRRPCEQLLQHPGQHLGFRGRSARHLEGHRNLVIGVGDQVQPVAEPRLHLLPHRAGPGVHPARLVLAPVGVGVRGLVLVLADPAPSSGSRSPCRRSRDDARSPATRRTARRAGSRSWRTPAPARPQAAQHAPENREKFQWLGAVERTRAGRVTACPS